MGTVQDYLNSLKFNGRNLGGGGVVDASSGGFTQSNAPFIFASLLNTLSKPGGPLSTLAQDKIFSGQVESTISQGQQARTNTARGLAANGVNEAQAVTQLGGFDQQVLQQIATQRGASEKDLQDAIAEATTQMANVTSQSDELQKQRAEDLRRFNKLYRNMKKQQQFSNILGVAGLALNFLGPLGTAASVGLNAAAKSGGNGPPSGQSAIPGAAPSGPGQASTMWAQLDNPLTFGMPSATQANFAGIGGNDFGGINWSQMSNALSNWYMLRGGQYPGQPR